MSSRVVDVIDVDDDPVGVDQIAMSLWVVGELVAGIA